MDYDDPNRPETLKDLSGRDYHGRDPVRTGNAAKDGYTVIARRPRSGFVRDTIDPEQADRIESLFRSED